METYSTNNKVKGVHNYETINRWKQWILTWCVKHRGQLLSSTCSILGLILKCTQIFEEETTHLIKQDSIPFHQWYQHHYYQLYHDCFNFGHSVPSAVLSLRVSNGFAYVIWTCKILEGEIPHIMMQCWLEARYQANEITKEMRGNQTTYHSGARLWRLARKISELAKWF